MSVALRCPPESYTGALELEKSGPNPGRWSATLLLSFALLLGVSIIVLGLQFYCSNYYQCMAGHLSERLVWGGRLQVVDCYTDPLGWNEVLDRGRKEDYEQTGVSTVCHDIANLSGLLSTILKSGRGIFVDIKYI